MRLHLWRGEDIRNGYVCEFPGMITRCDDDNGVFIRHFGRERVHTKERHGVDGYLVTRQPLPAPAVLTNEL